VNDLSAENRLFLMHASIFAGQHQGVVAEIEPDARRGEIGSLDHLGVEPVAIAIVADRQRAAAR